MTPVSVPLKNVVQ